MNTQQWFELKLALDDAPELLAEVERLREERDRLAEALRMIERMAGAGGSGEIPAMPIAARARKALSSLPEREDGKYGDWRDKASGTGGNYGE